VPATATATLADDLIESTGLLRRQLRRHTGRPWADGAVSSAQAELLRVVRRQPGVSVAEAAAELGLAANTVSTLVRSLADGGFLRREPDAADRRVARLTLTPATRRRVERWRDERTGVLTAAIDRLPSADRAALAAALPVLAHLATELRSEESR